MKVWVLHMDSYGEVDVFDETTDVTAIPFVKQELEYLLDYGDDYRDEYDGFIDAVDRARSSGRGEANVEERFSLELVEVKHVEVE